MIVIDCVNFGVADHRKSGFEMQVKKFSNFSGTPFTTFYVNRFDVNGNRFVYTSGLIDVEKINTTFNNFFIKI